VAVTAVRERRYLVVPSETGATLSWSPQAACSTICAASTCTLTLVRRDIRRSRSNASSGPPGPSRCPSPARSPTWCPSWPAAGPTPSRKISRYERARRARSRVTRARTLTPADDRRRARDSSRTASNRSRSSQVESPEPGSTLVTLQAAHGQWQGRRLLFSTFPAATARIRTDRARNVSPRRIRAADWSRASTAVLPPTWPLPTPAAADHTGLASPNPGGTDQPRTTSAALLDEPEQLGWRQDIATDRAHALY
jgi:hypothetical protein